MDNPQAMSDRRDFHRAVIALTAGALAAPTLAQTTTAAPSPEEPLVRATIETYFKGHATGQGSYMLKAFLPTAHIEGMRDGKFISWTLADYVSLFKGTPPADEATRTRVIDAVDISGTAATARASLGIPGFITTDFFVMLKVDGEWKIANKVFSVRPR